jgi:hypothetical protein
MDERRRRFLEELLPQEHAVSAAPPGGRPPDRLPGLGGGPTIWLAEHLNVFRLLLVMVAATLGYFGALGRSGTQPFGDGLPGLLYGVGLTIAVLAIVEL